MRIADFDYELPSELIAQNPLAQRDASRMMVLERAKRTWADSHFAGLTTHLRKNDVLVINNTRVFPARLIGRRDPSGGRIEALLVREVGPLVWEALLRPARKLKIGERLRFGDSRLAAEIIDSSAEGMRTIRFEGSNSIQSVLEELGQPPLPPYIKRPAGASKEDRERYQTIYARTTGAVAAPTAGLHFTSCIMNEILALGVHVAEVTLHVGYGTFEPVRVQEIENHKVAPERFVIDQTAAKVINRARAEGGRVVAVGTTATRTLESRVNAEGQVQPGDGMIDLTITPGYRFRVTDALLTNFHLPRSSLLLLVCAFAGSDFVLAAYRHAVDARYRFYSYGDCMLII